MTDRLGWRRKFGVIAPSTNTIVQPEFDSMRVPGVTSHYGRILIRDGRIGDDEGMEALLEQIRASMADCVEGIMTMQPDYMVMGMSAETFWDGVEGNRQFVAQIKELSGGLDVATGAEACERALKIFGAKKVGVVTDASVADQDPAVVRGDARDPHRVELGLDDGVGARGDHAELAAVAETIGHCRTSSRTGEVAGIRERIRSAPSR